MTTNLLQLLVREKMNKENLSLRKVGRATDISHTTISRILDGDAVDLDTLIAICKWLEIPPSRVLDGYKTDEGNLEARIGAILDLNPRLRIAFKHAMERCEADEVNAQVVEELLAYATFRLGVEREEDQSESP